MSTGAGYEPGHADRAFIEAGAMPINQVMAEIEAAAELERVPILDREAGRVLGVLAGGRRRIVEVGTAYGYSTLWMALGQPSSGTISTIDPDRSRTDLARGWWRAAGVADEHITVVNRPALDAFADGSNEAALSGPFDMAFIDALKEEYLAYLDAIVPRLVPGALVAADNVLWSGRVSSGEPAEPGSATAHLRAFDRAVLGDARFTSTILPVGDGLLIATYRG